MNKSNMRVTPVFPIGFLKPKFGRGGRGRLRREVSAGFTLVELLVAVTLSLVIMTALVALYGSISRTNNEMRKTNELIENGRFAIQLLQNDLALTGFWGDIGSRDIAELKATAVPDACLSYANWPMDVATRTAYKINLMSIPIQGYANGSTLAGCNVAGVMARSNVLIVRHANTCVAGSPGCDGGVIDTGPHIQVSGCRTAVPPEVPYVLDGNTASFTLLKKGCDPDPLKRAPIRKMIVNIYYVATSGGMPALMRVSMKNGVYSAPEPLVDGIDAFQVEYGIDTLGSNGLAISDLNPGDGNADTYVSCPAAGCAWDVLANAVSVKLHVLSRNLEPTAGYVNNKAYQVGSLAVPAFNDNYKRHVFSTAVRLVNIASRRESM